MSQVDIRRLDAAEEIRKFEHGSFGLVNLGGMTIGRATYEPGWRWSEHVGGGRTRAARSSTSAWWCQGRAAVLMDDGSEVVMEPGDLFYVPAGPRQLGRGRRALRVASLHGRGRLRRGLIGGLRPSARLDHVSHRSSLPQLEGGLFFTDGGLETTLIFHRGRDLPAFAAFDLLKDDDGKKELRSYFRPYLDVAAERGAGFVLESPTWRASPGWAEDTGYSPEEIAEMNRRSIALMEEIRAASDVRRW